MTRRVAADAARGDRRDEWRQVAFLYHRIAPQLDRALNEAGGISLAEHRVLECVRDLAAQRQHPYVRLVAARLGVSDSTASRTVAHLLAADPALLARDDPSFREVYLTLTDAGHRLLTHVEPALSRVLASAWHMAVDPDGARAAIVREVVAGLTPAPGPAGAAEQAPTHPSGAAPG